MKKTQQAADASSKLSWFKKFKVAVAALAFMAAGVFGASAVAEVPAPEVDETAQTYYVKSLEDYRYGGGGGMPYTGYSRSGSWS